MVEDAVWESHKGQRKSELSEGCTTRIPRASLDPELGSLPTFVNIYHPSSGVDLLWDFTFYLKLNLGY